MSDSRDPAIKLFGTTIPLPDISSPAAAEAGEVEVIAGEQSDGGDEEERPSPSANAVADGEKCSGGGEERESDKDQMDGDGIETRPESESLSHSSDKSTNRDATEGPNENQNTSSSGADESTASKPSKIEEEKSETNTSQEGTPKKPDKILPCPRCNSMDTKFCYYNNYNVNQPRHFCKNCQRYWTAGGTMRNVPVGAGRRKNKNSMAHYRPITIPEVVHSTRSEFPNGLHPALTTNASVVALGPDSPLCESMASVLNIAEKTMVNCTQTGLQNPELKVSDPFSRDDQLSGSSSKVDGTISGSKDPVPLVFPTLPSQTPCFPEASWPYTFLPPAFYPNTFAMPFYPTAPYWPCAVPSTWSIPWVSLPSPSNGHMSAGSGPNSPTLGKHSREESMIKSSASNENDPEKDGNSEKCLWIPKTLRINDPEEAAKSSIWTTLGIKNDDVAGAIPGNGIFKAFQSKAEVNKNHDISTSSVLQANPAALSRSQNFHESS